MMQGGKKGEGKAAEKGRKLCVGGVGGIALLSWEAEHIFLLLSPFLLPWPLPTSGGLVAKASEHTQVLSEHPLWHLTRCGRLNNGPPKTSMVPFLEPINVTLYGK